MQILLGRAVICALAGAIGFTSLAIAGEQDRDRASSGQVIYHYVGRVSLNFATSKAVIVGYLTHLDGVPATVSLFRGTPGETTALFTFRADASFQPLPGNGELGGGSFAVLPTLIMPGDFKIYFNTSPSRSWNDPDGFSSGQMIAALTRELEQFAILGSIGSNTATATLKSSTDYLFDNRVFNFRNLARAVTNVTLGNVTPLAGSTQTAPSFAFAGYGTAVGK